MSLPTKKSMDLASALYTPCKPCGNTCEDEYGRPCSWCLGEGTNAPCAKTVALALDAAREDERQICAQEIDYADRNWEKHTLAAMLRNRSAK